jgi:hypothetical protein
MNKIDNIVRDLFFAIPRLNLTYPFSKEAYGSGTDYFYSMFQLPKSMCVRNRKFLDDLKDTRKLYKVGTNYFRDRKHAVTMVEANNCLEKHGLKWDEYHGFHRAKCQKRHTTVTEVTFPTDKAISRLRALEDRESTYKSAARTVGFKCWDAYVSYAALRDVYSMLCYAKYGIRYTTLSGDDKPPMQLPWDYLDPLKDSYGKVAHGNRRQIPSAITGAEMLAMADSLLMERLPADKFAEAVLNHKDEVFSSAISSPPPLPRDLVAVIKHDLIEALREELRGTLDSMDDLISVMQELSKGLWKESNAAEAAKGESV